MHEKCLFSSNDSSSSRSSVGSAEDSHCTEGPFCSIHVPTSNSKIQAWVCFHILERCYFPNFDRFDI